VRPRQDLVPDLPREWALDDEVFLFYLILVLVALYCSVGTIVPCVVMLDATFLFLF
jgi:hypothetical protein